MSWKTDKLVDVCEMLEDDLPRAKRCLVALRRSGRDRMFTAHIGWRRLELEVAKLLMPLAHWVERI